MKLSCLAPGRTGEEEAREQFGFRLPDSRGRRRDLSFGAPNVGTPFHQISWEADLNARSRGGNGARLLQFSAQGTGFFSQENALMVNGNVDSTDQSGGHRPCGGKLRSGS